jgi:hypothetical protein
VADVGSSKPEPRYSPTVSSPLNSTSTARAWSAAPVSTAARSAGGCCHSVGSASGDSPAVDSASVDSVAD